jgi:dolichol-phosphate mannosyltransferase
MIFLLLPCYNESKSIEEVFRDISENFKGNYKAVLIDDGSTDGTSIIADRLATDFEIQLKLLKHKKNLGLGCALKTGFRWICENSSDGDIVITMDCDATHKAEFAKKMVEALTVCDVAIASRYVKGGFQKGVPFLRKLASFLVSKIFRTINSDINDWTSGFRAYRVEILRKTEIWKRIRERNFTSQLEILFHILKESPHICEVPLKLDYSSKKSASKFGFFSISVAYLRFLFCLLTKFFFRQII